MDWIGGARPLMVYNLSTYVIKMLLMRQSKLFPQESLLLILAI